MRDLAEKFSMKMRSLLVRSLLVRKSRLDPPWEVLNEKRFTLQITASNSPVCRSEIQLIQSASLQAIWQGLDQGGNYVNHREPDRDSFAKCFRGIGSSSPDSLERQRDLQTF